MQSSRSKVVSGRRVQSGEQLVHFESDGVGVAPDLAQVVANVLAQRRGGRDMASAEPSLYQTPANPDNCGQRPGLLNNPRGPEIGENSLFR